MKNDGSGVPFPSTVCCCLCGGYASVKLTKNRSVTSHCSKCNSRMFLNSYAALSGYLELCKRVEPSREQWSAAMDARASEMQQGPARSIKEVDDVVRVEHLAAAARGDKVSLGWVMNFSDGAQALGDYVRERQLVETQARAAAVSPVDMEWQKVEEMRS